MPWLDRDRMPVRFTVATSVVSGLIVTGVLAAVRTGFSGGAAAFWFLLTAAAVAALSVGAWLLYRRRRARRSFLVTSAFSQKYFVAAFVQSLHSALDRNDIDLVLKVPDRDYDAGAQAHHLRRLLARRRDYMGGVIIPTESQRTRDDLRAFCVAARLPVVFTDFEPFTDGSAYPARTAYVGYDTGELGELAGRWLATRLRNVVDPRVLVVASREHAARQERCVEALGLGLPQARVTVDDSGDFTRSRAERAVRRHLHDLAAGQRLDAIFCTNDEMALGAVDAIARATAATKSTVVVGIDGVAEARTLIDTGKSPLRATVVQDTHQLAVCIVDILEKLCRGESVAVRHRLSAEIYDGKLP
jgi:ribose transport system substrate-binding protein